MLIILIIQESRFKLLLGNCKGRITYKELIKHKDYIF